jgi:hypothetical protein
VCVRATHHRTYYDLQNWPTDVIVVQKKNSVCTHAARTEAMLCAWLLLCNLSKKSMLCAGSGLGVQHGRVGWRRDTHTHTHTHTRTRTSRLCPLPSRPWQQDHARGSRTTRSRLRPCRLLQTRRGTTRRRERTPRPSAARGTCRPTGLHREAQPCQSALLVLTARLL